MEVLVASVAYMMSVEICEAVVCSSSTAVNWSVTCGKLSLHSKQCRAEHASAEMEPRRHKKRVSQRTFGDAMAARFYYSSTVVAWSLARPQAAG